MKIEYKENLSQPFSGMPSWLTRTVLFLLLPLCCIAPMFINRSLVECLKEWWESISTKYIDKEIK